MVLQSVLFLYTKILCSLSDKSVRISANSKQVFWLGPQRNRLPSHDHRPQWHIRRYSSLTAAVPRRIHTGFPLSPYRSMGTWNFILCSFGYLFIIYYNIKTPFRKGKPPRYFDTFYLIFPNVAQIYSEILSINFYILYKTFW